MFFWLITDSGMTFCYLEFLEPENCYALGAEVGVWGGGASDHFDLSRIETLFSRKIFFNNYDMNISS